MILFFTQERDSLTSDFLLRISLLNILKFLLWKIINLLSLETKKIILFSLAEPGGDTRDAPSQFVQFLAVFGKTFTK